MEISSEGCGTLPRFEKSEKIYMVVKYKFRPLSKWWEWEKGIPGRRDYGRSEILRAHFVLSLFPQTLCSICHRLPNVCALPELPFPASSHFRSQLKPLPLCKTSPGKISQSLLSPSTLMTLLYEPKIWSCLTLNSFSGR